GQLAGAHFANAVNPYVNALVFHKRVRNVKNGRLLSTSRFFILSSSATEADQGKVSLPHFCPAFSPSSVIDDRGLATGLSK
ncbi:hypothetical protein MJI46_26095, partial [Salmonella enterica subsp. enterica serovar Cerro]|nr:hypothetical protein [Salmonella enterica subsp. enterica serovar Cerro]